MRLPRIPLVIAMVFAAGPAVPANAQTVTILYSFAGPPNDGNEPEAALVQGSDGNFYGTTVVGGPNGYGTVFRISPSGSYTNLHIFAGPPDDGFAPYGGLVQGTDSNLYGTTAYGGTDNYGIVFRITPSGSCTTLYSFVGSPNDGRSPFAGLAEGNDGNFYGTTEWGGSGDCNYGCGTVFQITPAGEYTSLYSFNGFPDDGREPFAGLAQGSDSNFYGTTELGGSNNYGTVFRISPSGSYRVLYSFGGLPADGTNPNAALVLGNDGTFYGTTGGGGTTNFGTVFRISPNGTYSNLCSFGSTPKGGLNPNGGLMQGSDSNFYGVTNDGGTHDQNGTVFRISPSGDYTTLHSFTGSRNDGANPYGGLVQGDDGDFYGTTGFGGRYGQADGDYGNGTVFRLAVGGGEDCTYALNATSVTLAAKGGSKNIGVKVKGTDCTWTAVSNDPFITITAGSSGAGSGKVIYTVPGNTNTTALTGTMTIAAETFTVNQTAGGCTFKLSPKAGKLKATGGSATVKVTPNLGDCEWSASSTDSFITITSGASGMGKGSVTYSVSANTSTNILAGTISIADESFTVIQAGVK